MTWAATATVTSNTVFITTWNVLQVYLDEKGKESMVSACVLCRVKLHGLESAYERIKPPNSDCTCCLLSLCGRARCTVME